MKSLISTLILGAGLVFSGCLKTAEEIKIEEIIEEQKSLVHELKVGETTSFSFNLLLENSTVYSTYLHYTGMPSKDVFAIDIARYNNDRIFFYPVSQKEINIREKIFEVLSVDSEKIKLKYLREI